MKQDLSVRERARSVHRDRPRFPSEGGIGRRALRKVWRIVVWLLFPLVGLSVFLHFVGVPKWATDRWIRAQEAHGRYLEIGRVTFNPFRGAVAHNVRFFESARRIVPTLEAETVALDLHAPRWLKGREVEYGLRVNGATARLSPSGPIYLADLGQVLVLRGLGGSLTWSEERLRVRRIEARVLGIRVRAEGTVDLSHSAGNPWLAMRAVGRRLKTGGLYPGVRRAWLTELISQINAIQFAEASELSVRFAVAPHDVMNSDMEISGDLTGVIVRGVALDAATFHGRFQNSDLLIETLSVREDGRALDASGVVHFADGESQARVESNLPASSWFSLIPIRWRDRLEELGFFVKGPIHFSADLGPARLEQLWQRSSGTLDIQQAEIRGVWFDGISLGFDCGEEVLQLRDVAASLGTQGELGVVRGAMNWRFSDHLYDGAFRSAVDFAAFLPVLSDSQVRLFRSFTPQREPLRAEVMFSGKKGDRGAFRLDGEVSGSDIFYRGAFISEGRAGLTMSNRVVTLDPLHVVRDEGEIDGLIRLDFEDRRIDLNLAGLVDPKAAGRASGERVERVLRYFDFGGPVRSEVAGSIHLNEPEKTSLRIRAEGEDVGLNSFVADRISADVVWTNRRVIVSDIDAEIYGGGLAGTFASEWTLPGEPALYELDMSVAQVSFEDVVRTLAHKEGEPYRGRITGTLSLKGRMGKGFGRSAVGQGHIHIHDGRILSIPLFGELSRGLSKIYPGLGFTKQTEFVSNFEVEDLWIKSEDVRLEGTMFSLFGDGRYGLSDRSLDFAVEFKLLRESGVGNVVRLVTLPITKLLEFDLEGKLEAPDWRPKNLPRELFPDFE